MKHVYLAAAAAAAVTTLASGEARAQTPTEGPGRFYAGAFAGVERPDEQTLSGLTVGNGRRDIIVDYDDGSITGGYLGVVVSDGSWGRIRADVEVSQRESEPESLILNDVSRELIDGSDGSVSAAILNVSYDTPQYWNRVRFSLGAGAGIAGVDNEILYVVNNPAATNGGRQTVALPTTETTWAYQLKAGIELALSDQWSLVGDVRYLDLGDYDVQRFILNTPGVGGGFNGTLDSILPADWSSTSFTAGVRYTF